MTETTDLLFRLQGLGVLVLCALYWWHTRGTRR